VQPAIDKISCTQVESDMEIKENGIATKRRSFLLKASALVVSAVTVGIAKIKVSGDDIDSSTTSDAKEKMTAIKPLIHPLAVSRAMKDSR
jgi:hypothetical protein